MFASLFITRSLTRTSIIGLFDANTQLGFPHFTRIITISQISSIKSFSSKALEEDSFTVSYLVNSCGLSLDSAKSASKRVCFQTPERPDAVLQFFKSHGLTNAQITRMIKSRAELLVSNVDRTFSPKVELFRSAGFSSADITTILSYPNILHRSLEKQIRPCYDILKSLLVPDVKIVKCFKRFGRFFHYGSGFLAPNIAILRNLRVPQSSIFLLLAAYPGAAACKTSKFEEIVKEVKHMGFNPMKSSFIQALKVLATVPNWKSRVEIYGRWGWSEDDTMSAFKKHPQCMTVSEKKIVQVMEFLVNKMGWQSEAVALYPKAFNYSFERRIVPRCSVIHVLKMKGLVKKDLSLGSVLTLSDEYFLKHFVTEFEDRVPKLLELYKGKVDLLAFESAKGMK